jgi:hypothetical protein
MTSGNKRMISKSEVGDRFTLIQPEAMMAPIVWLMSVHSDCVTGRRIIAKEWDADRLQREAPIRSAPQRDGEKPSRGVQRLKCSAASAASLLRSPNPAAQHPITSNRNQPPEPLDRCGKRCLRPP